MLMNWGFNLAATAVLLFVAWSYASAQSECVYPSMANVRPVVRAAVSDTDDGPLYTYVVRNQPAAQQVLHRFAVEARTGPNLSVSQRTPTQWESFGKVAESPFYFWSRSDPPFGLQPGEAATFGIVVSRGFPAIHSFLAWGLVDPPTISDVDRGECKGTDVLKNNFKGVSIGPRSIARPVVPGEFVNMLLTIVRKSRQQEWIQDDQTAQALIDKLRQAKRRLEIANIPGAQERLESVISDVQMLSCKTLDCDGKPLTSEAYALLFYNTRLLVRQLRGEPD